MKNRKGLLVAGIVAMWASFVAPAHAQLPPCSAGNNTGGRAIAERLADWAATYLSEEDPTGRPRRLHWRKIQAPKAILRNQQMWRR